MSDESSFNPRAAVKRITRGKGSYQYMQVKDRVFWFRSENPGGIIQTELLQWDPAAGVAVVRATVTIPERGTATGLGSACRADLQGKVEIKAVQPDQVESYVEFAETAALGRALGRLGYGTEDALDDAGPVDSPRPVESPAAAPAFEDVPAPGLTATQDAELRDLFGGLGWTGRQVVDWLRASYGATKLAQLSETHAATAIKQLRSMRGVA